MRALDPCSKYKVNSREGAELLPGFFELCLWLLALPAGQKPS